MQDRIVSRASILETFSKEFRKAQVQYKSFVENGLETDIDNPFTNVVGRGILGDEDFVNEVLANIEEHQLKEEEIAHRKALRRSSNIDAILAVVSDHMNMPVADMLRKGSESRKICVYLLKKYSDAANKEISEIISVNHYSSVVKISERFSKGLAGNKDLASKLRVLEEALSLVKIRPHG